MLKIQNFRCEISDTEKEIKEKLEKSIKSKVCDFEILRRSIDARRKSDIHYTLTIAFSSENEKALLTKKDIEIYNKEYYVFPPSKELNRRPVIIGFGPAGLFCALFLSRAGLNPIIIERGADVKTRTRAVEKFWNGGSFNPLTNVQFGEGGAGTFSDGKLNTGTRDFRQRTVLDEFVKFGADPDILVNAKPHIGTDVLRTVVENMRKEIIKNGAEVRFFTKLTDIITENNKVCGVKVTCDGKEEIIKTDNVVLAIGHSARDTFQMLYDKGIKMTQKVFSVGVRIEHSSEFISKSMYGDFYKRLPNADYKMAVHLKNGRSLYTFCMCPGGYVVASQSESETVVTNGMSYKSRDGKNSNSAILVNVMPSDLPDSNPLSGMYFQREIEKKAYQKSGGYFAPAETVGSFLGFGENKPGTVIPTYKPRIHLCKIGDIFPKFITDGLKEGLLLMDKKIKGFASHDAVLTAPETRSSSPVTFIRDEKFQLSIEGLYSAGEGGGHAGGITSSAVDGIKVAEAIAKFGR